MSDPVRIQLSRKKGWKMPENTVKVDRSTGFGNPYAGDGSGGDRAYLVDLFRNYCFRDAIGDAFRERVRRELRGKNLACWCPLPEPGQPDHCHAAVLLEIANSLPSPHTEKEG